MDSKKNYILKVCIALFLSFIWTIWLVVPASAEPLQGKDTDKEPYRVEEFNLDTPGELRVRTSGGHITVEGSETNTVRVEMYVKQKNRYLTASDTDLDDFEIEINLSGNRVSAVARREKGNGWFNGNNNISISFVVYTPREMSSELRTSGGHIEVMGLDGNQSIRTSGGHLNFSDMSGTVEGRTSGGHIDINGFEGEMNARTSGGHISTYNASGMLSLHTSGGHIKLDGVNGSVEARTSGGSITAELENIDEFANLRTSGGHVTITVPAGMGLDLDLKGSRVQTELRNFSGEVERDEIYGTINGGGPKLTARTSGGSVKIRYR